MSGGLIVDLFAGGGGASTGIEAALGRSVDVAINHDPIAIAVHEKNHPGAKHWTTDIWDVKPREATKGRPVLLLHASPDCKHFSRAKGGKPKSQGIRSLAWVVLRWARESKPQVITLENVPEFVDWGPLDAEHCPIPERKGETFARWRRDLERLGYVVEWRTLIASHYGAPTSRKRLFLVARRDGKPIVWPKPTHGPGLLPFNTAAQCIDWTIPVPSIFDRKKPLAEKTLRRIAAGIRRFVLESADPFIIPVNHGGGENRSESLGAPLSTVTAARRGHALVTPFVAKLRGDSKGSSATEPLPTITAGGESVRPGTGNVFAAVAPTLIQTSYGERKGQAPRVLDLHAPLGTVVAQGQKHSLVAAFLAKHYGGVVGQPVDKTIGTITAVDHHSLVAAKLARNHNPEVRAFLTNYYGSEKDVGRGLNEPMRTVVTKDRFGLVTVKGVDYQIVDIGMRMLEPHELLAAQFGRFARTYDMSPAKTKKDAVRLIGNSVCPELEEAIIAANFPREAQRRAA